MKPVASTMSEVDNLPGDEVKFSISPANSAWIMRSMADLYSNRELACVREYSTNAYDSNKEKAIRDGHDVLPIEVNLPTPMNPYFTVRDRGVGMSYEELTKVYTQFGESTKRDSDDFNGMLGFGSKSAIAYTNTFTVTSVKNGRKNVAVVTRREDAMGGYLVTLKVVVEDMATSEDSGVEIQIPVHNAREFEQKANDFYRFWTPGTVLVNGRQPSWAVGEKIDDGLYYYAHTQGNNTSYVVMGNVPYRIINSDALFPKGMNRISFVAYVPLGTVEFTPSREDLKYSEHTKKNLRKIITDFVDKSVSTAKADIAKATTHAEAYKAWVKWRKVIGSGQVEDLTFKGDKLSDTFAIEGHRFDTHAYRYAVESVKQWSVELADRTIFVTGFDVAGVAAPIKKKVKDWMNHTNRSSQFIVFTKDTTLKSPWVDSARVVSWDQVKKEAPKAAKKPKATVAWGRKAGSFDLITRSGRKAEQDVPSAKDLYYVMVKEYNLQKNLSSVLRQFNLDHEVVLVPANRKDKFLRHYPKAKEILPELKAQVVLDGMSLISPEGIIFLSTNHSERALIAKMDTTMIDDPQIDVLQKIFKKNENDFLADYAKNFALARTLGLTNKFKRHNWESYWDAKDTPLTKSYPLATNFSPKTATHTYMYMNAVYKARKEGRNV